MEKDGKNKIKDKSRRGSELKKVGCISCGAVRRYGEAEGGHLSPDPGA